METELKFSTVVRLPYGK